jgi:hypothetical protein
MILTGYWKKLSACLFYFSQSTMHAPTYSFISVECCLGPKTHSLWTNILSPFKLFHSRPPLCQSWTFCNRKPIQWIWRRGTWSPSPYTDLLCNNSLEDSAPPSLSTGEALDREVPVGRMPFLGAIFGVYTAKNIVFLAHRFDNTGNITCKKVAKL